MFRPARRCGSSATALRQPLSAREIANGKVTLLSAKVDVRETDELLTVAASPAALTEPSTAPVRVGEDSHPGAEISAGERRAIEAFAIPRAASLDRLTDVGDK